MRADTTRRGAAALSCRLRVDLGILKVNSKGQHTEKYNIYCFSAGHMMISCCNTIQQLAAIWIQFLAGKTPVFVNLGQEQVSHCFLLYFFFLFVALFHFLCLQQRMQSSIQQYAH